MINNSTNKKDRVWGAERVTGIPGIFRILSNI